MEPPSYMQSVVDRDVVMRRVPVCLSIFAFWSDLISVSTTYTLTENKARVEVLTVVSGGSKSSGILRHVDS
jgi:hypothetical protein